MLPAPSSHPNGTTAMPAPWPPEPADGGSRPAPSSRGSSSTTEHQQFPAQALRHRGSCVDVRVRTSSTSPLTLPPQTGLELEHSTSASTLCLLQGASGKGRPGERGCSQHLLCPVRPCTHALLPCSCAACAWASTFGAGVDRPGPCPSPRGESSAQGRPLAAAPALSPGLGGAWTQPQVPQHGASSAPALQQRLSKKSRLWAALLWGCNQRDAGTASAPSSEAALSFEA